MRVLVLVLSLTAGAAQAQSLASMTQATDLGGVIAAELPCGFTYDQSAISSWIDRNVDPSEMGFAGLLSTMVMGAEYELEGMSESARTAYCRSVRQTALHYGFLAGE